MDTVLQYNARIIEGKKMALCMRELKQISKCSCCERLLNVRKIQVRVIKRFQDNQGTITSSHTRFSCKTCIDDQFFAQYMFNVLVYYDNYDLVFLHQLFVNMYYNNVDVIDFKDF